MIKKMEISCDNCNKKYKNRTCFERHRSKCGNELMNIIVALTKRVEQLERQLGVQCSEPTMNFSEFVKSDFSDLIEVDWDEKASDIYRIVIEKIFLNASCIRKMDKTLVYENEWVPLGGVSHDCIESFVRSIQTKLLKNVPQGDNYFKNIIKITGVDIKKVSQYIKKL
jgi:hypothetical protein